jgi:hypothetical protein
MLLPVKLLFAGVIAATALTLTEQDDDRASSAQAGDSLCLTLNAAEAQYLMREGVAFGSGSDEGERYRTGTGLNFTVPADSVTLAPADSLRCDTAARRYRTARQAKYPGASNELFPIALVRVGSHAFIGDSQFGDPACCKELVLFDAQLNVRSITRGKL